MSKYIGNKYMDLTNEECLEWKQTIVDTNDEGDMILIKDFIDWYGDKVIEIDRFEDKWYEFIDIKTQENNIQLHLGRLK
jgi:hypothetical protein